MGTPKHEEVNISRVQWSTLDLVRGDKDTSFECPNCGTRNCFSHKEASRKIPEATGELRPVGQTVRLTSAILFDHIYDRQPLIRGLGFAIGIAAAILLIWFWRQTIWEGGSVPIWGGALALFGGWVVMQLVQHAISPRLPLWQFNCAECGAEYVLATNGTQGLIGDHKGRIEGNAEAAAAGLDAVLPPTAAGAVVPQACRRCGAPNDPDAQFCTQCGNKLLHGDSVERLEGDRESAEQRTLG